MTPFALILDATGMSQTDAATVCNVRIDTIKSWCIGRRDAPPGAFDDVRAIFVRQLEWSDQLFAKRLQFIAANGREPTTELIGFDIAWPSHDGLTTRTGHRAMGMALARPITPETHNRPDHPAAPAPAAPAPAD